MTESSGNSNWKSGLLLSAASLLITLIIAEVALRSALGQELAIIESERTLAYQHDEDLGWFPIPNSEHQFELTTSINLKHNSRGFRDIEHELDDKPTILFLGDSFTWGYDVEAEERFTDIIRDSLPDWNVFNLGISGYGTDQQYLLLQKHIDYYQPDKVVFIYCQDNDRLDNTMNIRYVNYYKPYFLMENDSLVLHGKPAPESSLQYLAKRPLLSKSYIYRMAVNGILKQSKPEKLVNPDVTEALYSEVTTFLSDRGVEFYVGLQESDKKLEIHLDSINVPYTDLTNDMVFPFSGNHWTPEGHQYVAGKLLELLDN